MPPLGHGAGSGRSPRPPLQAPASALVPRHEMRPRPCPLVGLSEHVIYSIPQPISLAAGETAAIPVGTYAMRGERVLATDLDLIST